MSPQGEADKQATRIFCVSFCLYVVCMVDFFSKTILSSKIKSFGLGREYSRTGFKTSWLILNDYFFNLSRKSVSVGSRIPLIHIHNIPSEFFC